MFEQLLALSAKELLGLTALAAGITTFGTLCALVLKEYTFARSFERWKGRRELEAIYHKFRDPILLAADELSIRFKEICEDDGADYLRSEVLATVPERSGSNWAGDPYYRRYKFESTLYRLCAFLGWCELYRQEVVFLRSGRARHNRALKNAVDAVREALADGQLNDELDWMEWHDHLIFREEQRAMGETMVVSSGESRTVMGYAQFVALFREGGVAGGVPWLKLATEFLVDLEARPRDFRMIRIKALYVRLVDLIERLDKDRVRESHRDRRARYLKSLPEFARQKLSYQEKRRRVHKVLAWRTTARTEDSSEQPQGGEVA